jgi:hypothetical protein
VIDDYTILIPSHGRARSLRTRTLAMLERLGVAHKAIVVVAPEDRDEYEAELPGVRFVRGKLGIIGNMNAVAEMMPTGYPVISMDDDLLDVKKFVPADPDGHRASYRSMNGLDFDLMIRRGFALMEKFNGGMWGVSPTHDPFYCSDKSFHVGARQVEGCMFGFVSGKTDAIRMTSHSAFDDMERVCRVFDSGMNVVRLNHYSHFQSMSTEGGKDASLRGAVNQCDEVQRIVREHPKVACHTFGKLPGQSHCRVNIRTRYASVGDPRSLAEVEAMRDKLAHSETPPLPDLHDVAYVPDLVGRAVSIGAALMDLDEASWKLLASDDLGRYKLENLVRRYVGSGTYDERAALANEIRREVNRISERPLSDPLAAVKRAANRVHAAGKLMRWDEKVRP